MFASRVLYRTLFIGALAVPALSFAQVEITADIAPPPLPVYVQPIAPAAGYLWTPGYWAYGPDGYYWIPGVWVRPPRVGVLWTPPWWGFVGGAYGFHAGYWGPTVGFYGGINYGYGYGGIGFVGGRWNGGVFAYNRAVANVNVNVIHNTYVQNVQNVSITRTSFNGGNGGVRAQPTPGEERALHEEHFAPTANQQQHFEAAQHERSQYASANGGRPQTLAMQDNRSGFGHANEVNARQGNQQSRITQGTRSGQITPGEENHLQNRENNINGRANADRAANGGALNNQERRQINRQQNNVSRAVSRDKHNANNDAAAAARQGRAPGQERHQAQQERRAERPQGPERERR